MLDRLRHSRRDLVLFGLLVLAGLMARGGGLLGNGFSHDYYNIIYNENPLRFVGLGRFGVYYLSEFFELFYFSPAEIPFFSASAFIVALSWVAMMAVRLWSRGRDVPAPLLFLAAVLIVLHPYMAEHLYFQDFAIFPAIGFSLMAVAVTIATWRRLPFALAVLLMVASLSLYQVSINLAAVMIAFAGLATLQFPTAAESRLPPWSRLLRSDAMAAAVMVALALVLYTVLKNLVILGFGIPTDYRSEFLQPGRLARRVYEFGFLAHRILGDNILPNIFQYLLFVFAALLLGFGIARALRPVPSGHQQPPAGQGLLAVALGWGLILAALLSVIVIVVTLNVWWPAARSLSGLAIFSGGLAFAAMAIAPPRLRAVQYAVCAVAAFGLMGTNAHIMFDQQRVTTRDVQMANRILAAAEAQPGFLQARSLAVVGMHVSPPDMLRTVYMDLNVSAFGPYWSQAGILREISGYRFAFPTPQELETAKAHCAQTGAFPAPRAVAVLGTLIVVCV